MCSTVTVHRTPSSCPTGYWRVRQRVKDKLVSSYLPRPRSSSAAAAAAGAAGAGAAAARRTRPAAPCDPPSSLRPHKIQTRSDPNRDQPAADQTYRSVTRDRQLGSLSGRARLIGAQRVQNQLKNPKLTFTAVYNPTDGDRFQDGGLRGGAGKVHKVSKVLWSSAQAFL